MMTMRMTGIGMMGRMDGSDEDEESGPKWYWLL